ncbi:CDP-alcohol phosphatidyltransferase family protein [Falsiroseomonas tokyonensis]|uniref:CDP-diacylglycerol--glycerol-3-phosphate 3-phosphatidyltransferase n=1 Tax=Falsiroseomonas tokyonensis TaxID=430521 RepID=A0ABV7BUB1_9PROT|nr:CDP-alcohol phosphatidyltransferase family protein [Falsiroseomonas tokyonensis]MBU8539095.1 CDP-alcohol phosphatidyltransferase family protein [Falsiroseomonas tokyonensis]
MPGGADPAAAPPPTPPADAGPFTLPNAITFARLCAVPAAIWLMLQHRLDLAFWVFVAAGVSDGLDGWLARRRNSRSALGAMMDPVADKALLVSVYVTLAGLGVLPDWLAILVVFRDLLIVGGVLVLYLLGQPPLIKPLWISKLNTLLQIGLAAFALLMAGYGLGARPVLEAAILLVALTTFASGAAYVVQAARSGR